MLVFQKSAERWWQKPLAEIDGRPLPAELAVLHAEIREGEAGVWLNSRGVSSGATDLVLKPSGKLATVRAKLPPFVTESLRSLYASTGLKRGVPDLVLWEEASQRIRLIEVKCPEWDRPSEYQVEFHSAARDRGIEVSVVEWRFAT